MSESKHTPGPWRFHNGRVVDGCFENLARPFERAESEETKANGYLIAATPDLLAACKEAVALPAHGIGAVATSLDDWTRANVDRNIREIKRILGVLEAAIRKAEGGAR